MLLLILFYHYMVAVKKLIYKEEAVYQACNRWKASSEIAFPTSH